MIGMQRDDLLLYFARNQLRIGLAVVLCLYAVIYGTLLFVTDGLPYVFDNNETFSSIIHAENMLTYGFSESFGLTDESYGRTAAAHPYVYTHQGNFPRFYALLIYVLGAKSAEAQIVVTTFTIGIIGILLAYDLVARRAGWAVGVLFCGLLMTDYAMVAQWNVVTWRVWHALFFFLSLWCVERAAERPERVWPWCLALAAGHAAMFYFELVFGVFTGVATGFFTLYRLRFSQAVRTIAAQAAGMLISISVLIGQLLAYFGWENFLTDVRYTFLARNESTQDGTLEKIEQFMLDHHIVFWFNINSQQELRRFSVMLENFLTYTMTLYTPAFVSIVIIMAIGLLGSCICRSTRFARDRRVPLFTAQTIIACAFSFYVLYVIVGFDAAGLYLREPDNLWVQTLLAGIGFLLIVSLMRSLDRLSAQNALPLTWVVASVSTIIGALSWMIMTEGKYGDVAFGLYWSKVAAVIGADALKALTICAGWIAVRIALSPARAKAVSNARIASLLPFVASGLLAFLIAYLLSPGYVLTGYLQRYVPLVTFTNLLVLTVGISAACLLLWNELRGLTGKAWWAAWRHPRTDGVRLRPIASVVVADCAPAMLNVVVVAMVLVNWFAAQAVLIDQFPPDHASFLKKLREPPFAGSSFVVNTYSAPVSVQTHEWSYQDSLFSTPNIKQGPDGPEMARDLRYLWLTDRATNPDYLRPEYFLCMIPQNVGLLRYETRQTAGGCSRLAIMSQTQGPIRDIVEVTPIARDESGRDRWAIARLDWKKKIPSSANARP